MKSLDPMVGSDPEMAAQFARQQEIIEAIAQGKIRPAITARIRIAWDPGDGFGSNTSGSDKGEENWPKQALSLRLWQEVQEALRKVTGNHWGEVRDCQPVDIR